MTQIKYKIEFFSYWHCGAGLSAGANADQLVIKDRDGLPYLPGRTAKGLIRDAAVKLCSYRGISPESIEHIFGKNIEAKEERQGKAFFTNATLSDAEQNAIRSNAELRPHLYRFVASTAIDDAGIAKEGSLRTIEVVVPCTLHGEISGIEDTDLPIIKDALALIKQLGVGRNRGYGRCEITIEKN